MGLFTVRKPRGFNHHYIYYNPRKEKLQKIEERAKRELGLLPAKEFQPENIKGKFVGATQHLRRKKEREKEGHKKLSNGVLVMIIIALLLIARYFLM